LEKQPPQLLLDVGGVGYEIEAPMSTFYQLPATGESLILHTHLVVRDDAHLLYGFSTESERRMFRSLIRINGVGAKLALTILSGISADEFARSIQESDTATLVRLPGVGKKTAERLVVEMRDRLTDWQVDTAVPLYPSDGMVRGASTGETRDAISALVSLGYKAQEASRLISKLDTEGMSSEEIIRAALKSAVK
jgi:Holliday junction DNA helicase RuvA